MTYRCLFSAWIWNLDSQVYLKFIDGFEYISLETLLHQLKAESTCFSHAHNHQVINTNFASSTRLCTEAFVFMILISESWCGRQRVSLKLELWSTAGFALSPHTYQCKQSGSISPLFYSYLVYIKNPENFQLNRLKGLRINFPPLQV